MKVVGFMVFYVVLILVGVFKVVEVGVDGLVVEGGEGGGFKNFCDVVSMVFLLFVVLYVRVLIVVVGGICDGCSMAVVFVLGVEGV